MWEGLSQLGNDVYCVGLLRLLTDITGPAALVGTALMASYLHAVRSTTPIGRSKP